MRSPVHQSAPFSLSDHCSHNIYVIPITITEAKAEERWKWVQQCQSVVTGAFSMCVVREDQAETVSSGRDRRVVTAESQCGHKTCLTSNQSAFQHAEGRGSGTSTPNWAAIDWWSLGRKSQVLRLWHPGCQPCSSRMPHTLVYGQH